MKPNSIALLLALALVPVPVSAQESDPSARDVTAQFTVPEGLRVTRWAESPQLFNPTAMDVDAEGRVWVTEAVNYRKWEGRNPGRDHPQGDRVVVLEDRDGDGACDHSTVFAQDPDLVAPLGICVLGTKVYVSCSPHLLVYEDTNGDGKADRRETLLTGFGGFDHDHGLHSVVPGPEGALYFNAGNAGPHLVTDAAGWTLRSGSAYSGGGPEAADNRPGMQSDDGKVWVGGIVLRVEPDGTGLQVLAHNFRNNYEVAVDSFGNLFQSDNDDDGNASCRTLFCLEGGNHGYFSADGSRYWQVDARPGQSIPDAHWHQDDPGVVPAGALHGAGGPTGVAVYEGALLRPWIDGAVLNADAGARVVYAHLPVAAGAGFELLPGALLRPRPDREDRDAHWFRPSDVLVLPDGSVLVADWYDPGVGGHAMGDREAYGRLLRIAPPGHEAAPRPIRLATLEGQLDAFRSPAPSVREMGRRALVGTEEGRLALRSLVTDEADPRLRARALLALARCVPAEFLAAHSADPDEGVRVAAVRALARASGGRLSLARIRELRLAADPGAGVRREVALSLRDVPLQDKADVMRQLARPLDGRDRFALEAFGLAAAAQEEETYALLAAEFGEVPRRWDPRFEALVWRLHPQAAAPALLARALDPTLERPARQRSIDALAFQPSRAAADAVLTIAQAGPEDLRGYATWWVQHRDGNDWRAYGLARQLGLSDLADATLAFQSDTMRKGAIEIDVDVRGADTLWMVVTDGGDGNSCDWADWIEPRFVAGERTWRLAGSRWQAAEAEWGEVRWGANAAGGPLRIGADTYAEGIGTHASSTIAYAVPEGAGRFRVRAGPDAGGTDQQGGASTSITFEIWLGLPEAPSPVVGWLAALRSAETPRRERQKLAEQLALDPRGALSLMQAQQQGTLDPALEPTVARAIFRNPDLGVRALASEHFARPADGQNPLPPLAELLQREGEPAAGREVFLHQAQCLSCHAFQLGDRRLGKDVGPELTRIREKLDRAALLDAILNPSAGIALGYEAWVLETREGDLVSGFLLADGETIVLKDTQDQRLVFERDQIVSRRKQALSTMPDGIASGLNASELIDLVAFLQEDPGRAPVFGEEVVLFDGSNLDAWIDHQGEDALQGGVWTIQDGVLHCEGQPIGYLRTREKYESFALDLEWRFDPARGAGNSGVLLRMVGEDKIWPRSIEAQLLHQNAGDIWNIDEFGLQADPQRTQGRRTARSQPCSERPLGEWNRYVILLDGPRIELRVNGVLQNTADWCEEVAGFLCLQSEGAAIQFRDIRLRPILR